MVQQMLGIKIIYQMQANPSLIGFFFHASKLDLGLPVAHFCLPFWSSATLQKTVDELHYTCCPILDPFSFTTGRKATGCPLSLKCTDLISPDALSKPYSTPGRDVLRYTMIKKLLPSDAMWNTSTETSKWYCRIRKVV